MTSSRSVLIGLRRRVAEEGAVRRDLEGWVQEHGFEPHFTVDPKEAIELAREHSFAANFVDAGWEMVRGQSIWRVLQPVVGARMVLMTSAGRTELLFEALQCGIAAVLPLPAQASTVRAALRAAAGGLESPEGFADRWRRK